MAKRALISVTDKEGIVEFAKGLVDLGYEIISTGNTHKILSENNVNALNIEDVTKFPEILDGRVKTLNPYIHGGILYRRDKKEHVETVNELNINPIDIVVVNLYNFKGALESNKGHENIIENIDIGGPSLIRSSAKNYKDVLVVVDPSDYSAILEKIKNDDISIDYRLNLASKAFMLTAHYDSLISNYFKTITDEKYPKYLNLTFEKEDTLRYGENPHQNACLYKESYAKSSVLDFEQLNGKELSFNNINDAYGALEILREFKNNEIVAVAVKHTNPCGVGQGASPYEAYIKSYESDPVSIFGGIVGINSIIDEKTAIALNEIFLEIVMAYDYTPKALEILKTKKNLRVLKIKDLNEECSKYEFKYLDGKLLAQDKNESLCNEYKVATKKAPSENELRDMEFGMKIVKHMKSNAIAIVKDNKTLALGGGQTSRIVALKNALENNKDKDFNGAILASDAFFPFDDCVRLAKEYGISAVIHPGGSMNDKLSIDACDEENMSMVLSGIRHFKH